MVVRMLLTAERLCGRREVAEVMLPPELLVVDPMAPLDLPVLLWPSWSDVAMADPDRLDRERKGRGEFLAVVILESPDGEGKGLAQLGEKSVACLVVEVGIETEDAEACAVVQRRVLVHPAMGHFDKLHIDLDTVTRPWTLEELELPGRPLRVAAEIGKTEINEQPLDGTHGQGDLVATPEPYLRPGTAVAELPPCVRDQGHDVIRDPAPPPRRIAWHETQDAPLTSAGLPPPNRPGAKAHSFRGLLLAQLFSQLEPRQPLAHSPPKLPPNP